MKAAETKPVAASSPKSIKPFFGKDIDHALSAETEPTFFNKLSHVPPIQTKLNIGPAGDQYEKEADKVADKVVQRKNENPGELFSGVNTSPIIQSKCSKCESEEKEEKLQKKELDTSELPVQTKLSIGRPDDPYEKEADHVADKVVQKLSEPAVQAKPVIPVVHAAGLLQTKNNTLHQEEQKKEEEKPEELPVELQKRSVVESLPDPPAAPDNNDNTQNNTGIQLKCSTCEEKENKQVQTKLAITNKNTVQLKCEACEREEKLQKKSTGDAHDASPSIESKLTSRKGSGSPLPDPVRNDMESSIGADFGNVKIHTDSTAIQMSKDLNAQAFTHGSDIYFNSGKYDTNSNSGKHLLAHELTHTVQQGSSSTQQRQLKKTVQPKIQRQINYLHQLSTEESQPYLERVTHSIESLESTIQNRLTEIPDDIRQAVNLLRNLLNQNRITCWQTSNAFSYASYDNLSGEIRLHIYFRESTHVTTILHEAIHALHAVQNPELARVYGLVLSEGGTENIQLGTLLQRFKAWTEYWAYRRVIEYENARQTDPLARSDAHREALARRDVAEAISEIGGRQAFDPSTWVPPAGWRPPSRYRQSQRVQRKSLPGNLDEVQLTNSVGETIQKKNELSIQKLDMQGNDQALSAKFIVEENVTPGADQLTKSRFLTRLNREVCTVTDEVLAGSPFSSQACPYITRAFNKLSVQTAQQIERVLFRYESSLEKSVNLEDFFRIVRERVRISVSNWLERGDLSGIPVEIAMQIPESIRMATRIGGELRSGLSAITSGAKNLFSGIGGIFFKSQKGDAHTNQSPQQVLQELGEGKSMGTGTKNKMEKAFGSSFSNVKLHTDATSARLASDMNARAFTVSNHIAFGSNEYHPGTLVGDALMAHELAHVEQQSGNNGIDNLMQKSDYSDENILEEQADDKAINVVSNIWNGSNDIKTGIPKAKKATLKSGLKLQRCDTTPPYVDINAIKIEVYTMTDLLEPVVDPGEAITNDFSVITLRLNNHNSPCPRPYGYQLLNTAQQRVTDPRFADDKGIAKMPLVGLPNGEYIIQADVYVCDRSKGINGMVPIQRRIRIIDSLKDVSNEQLPNNLNKPLATHTLSNDLMGFEQFSAIIRQNAVTVAGVPVELVEAWNKAHEQAIMLEASIDLPINSGLEVNAKNALQTFYTILRSKVVSNDVTTYDVRKVQTDFEVVEVTINKYITEAETAANISTLTRTSSPGTPAEWRRNLQIFYRVTQKFNEYIADKLTEAGYADSANQLKNAGQISNHLRELFRDHPDAKPVEAVFYPKLQSDLHNDAPNGAEPHYSLVAYHQRMYTYRTNDGVWHLADLTNPAAARYTSESGGTETLPPNSLITELDDEQRFPEGIIYFRFYNSSQINHYKMTHPWSASDYLNLASIMLGAAGLVAAVAASGGLLAPVVPTVCFVVSGLLGAAGAAVHIHESDELGVLTSKSLSADVISIAVNLLGAAAGGLGHIVKAAQASDAAWTGWRGLAALGAQAIYRPVSIASLGSNVVSLAAFSIETAEQYAIIRSMPDGEAKTTAMRRLVAMSLLNGGMTLIAIRGGMIDINAGATLYLDFTTINGVRTPVAYRVMPQADILAHPRLTSVKADVESFLAQNALDESTINQFRSELSVALETSGISENEIKAFVQQIRSAPNAVEARLVLIRFRDSRINVSIGGVSRNIGYDLSYLHTSETDFHVKVKESMEQPGIIAHNGMLSHVDDAPISSYLLNVDTGAGNRVQAAVEIKYADFTQGGSTIGTGTIASGAAYGPARNTVHWDPVARSWTVRIEVDQRLAPGSFRRVIGHELDEAGDIISRLHGHTETEITSGISLLHSSAMFESNGVITSHDVATLREIDGLLINANTNSNSGEQLSGMLADIGLTTDRAAFQSRLSKVMSSGIIDQNRLVMLEAWSTYDMAVARGSRISNIPREEFINRYFNGERFDEGGSFRWYNLDNDPGTQRQFFTDAEIADPNLAFNRLAGAQSSSSFKAYHEMLTTNGIANEAKVKSRLSQLLASPRGRDLDYVRHTLKESFRDDIISHLTNRRALRRAHPDVPFEEASHIEMLEITSGLNSSDKGSIAEQWYRAVFARDATVHVRFDGASGTPRYADLTHRDGTIQDIKNTTGSLSARELDQFEDYRRLINTDVTIPSDTGPSVTVNVKRIRYVFLDPEGVRANATWMHTKLTSSSGGITFEIFNSSGQRRIINSNGIYDTNGRYLGGINFLNDPIQLNWLNQ